MPLKGAYVWRRFLSSYRPVTRGIRYTVRAAFGKYLFVTNTASCGVLMLLGDLIQQEIQHRRDCKKKLNVIEGASYDKDRLVKMFIVGVVAGPLNHYYYKFVNTIWPTADLVSVGKKILADQIVMSPISIAQFFYTAGLLEKKTLTECNEEFAEKFLQVYLMDWSVWPPAQFLNFYFIPFRFQVLYINAITVIYNVFLSYIKHDL